VIGYHTHSASPSTPPGSLSTVTDFALDRVRGQSGGVAVRGGLVLLCEALLGAAGYAQPDAVVVWGRPVRSGCGSDCAGETRAWVWV
jgi:hypothetical protein